MGPLDVVRLATGLTGPLATAVCRDRVNGPGKVVKISQIFLMYSGETMTML